MRALHHLIDVAMACGAIWIGDMAFHSTLAAIGCAAVVGGYGLFNFVSGSELDKW